MTTRRLRNELADIKSKLAHHRGSLERLAKIEEPTADQIVRHDEDRVAIDRLEEIDQTLEDEYTAREDRITQAASHPENRDEPRGGVGPAEYGDLPRRPGSDFRSQALTINERSTTMPDHARERVARTLDHDTDPQSRLARYIIEAGNPDYKSAFEKWFADPEATAGGGHYAWTPQERESVQRVRMMTRALQLGTQGGGFLSPFALDPAIIIANEGSVDPMRRVARVELTAANETRFITSEGIVASWVAEGVAATDDSPTLVNPAINAFKGLAWCPVSFELFEDAGNIGEEVQTLFVDAKAQLEAQAFTTGSGVGQARGIITALVAIGGASVIDTGTNAFAQGDLYANQAALPARWRPRAEWMMNLSVLNEFRQLPQATGLNFSIVNDDGPQPKALGWLIEENSTMDGTLNAVAADYAVLSGDFRNYIIVDRIGTSVEFVPNVFGGTAPFKPTGQRGFLLHWRAGGDVVVGDAFRLSNYSA